MSKNTSFNTADEHQHRISNFIESEIERIAEVERQRIMTTQTQGTIANPQLEQYTPGMWHIQKTVRNTPFYDMGTQNEENPTTGYLGVVSIEPLNIEIHERVSVWGISRGKCYLKAVGGYIGTARVGDTDIIALYIQKEMKVIYLGDGRHLMFPYKGNDSLLEQLSSENPDDRDLAVEILAEMTNVRYIASILYI